jgi:hypothetical protein
MNVIRFSHDYYKLPEGWQGKEAVLIGVSYCNDMQTVKQNLPNFLKYDATIRTEDPWDQKQYPLDFKEGIILIFVMIETGIPFTTIRRSTPEKLEYYQGNLWKSFLLEYTRKDG